MDSESDAAPLDRKKNGPEAIVLDFTGVNHPDAPFIIERAEVVKSNFPVIIKGLDDEPRYNEVPFQYDIIFKYPKPRFANKQ
jgi:hypothetical protein